FLRLAFLPFCDSSSSFAPLVDCRSSWLLMIGESSSLSDLSSSISASLPLFSLRRRTPSRVAIRTSRPCRATSFSSRSCFIRLPSCSKKAILISIISIDSCCSSVSSSFFVTSEWALFSFISRCSLSLCSPCTPQSQGLFGAIVVTVG
ncbi:hypothetical protein PENTCL1PPCAC_9796, partial [Pristionchus entomophagus]